MVIRLSEPDIRWSDFFAIYKVLKSKWLVSGAEQIHLERELANYLNYEHAVGCSSWTTGAFMVLKALGIGPGDEVIVPSYSFIASSNVVKHVGAEVVFCDISCSDWNIDLDDLASKITEKTKAVIAVDQHGIPLRQDILEFLAKKNLFLLRDVACGLGTNEIAFNNTNMNSVAVTSFHARKIITGGEGGMIFTNDINLRDNLRLLRHQGMDLTDHERKSAGNVTVENYPIIGYNFRMTDLQASLVRSQFRRLDKILKIRRRIASFYLEFLPFEHIDIPKFSDKDQLNWQSFMISIKDSSNLNFRNSVIKKLNDNGIHAKKGISPAHLEKSYLEFNSIFLPNTMRGLNKNILLPIHTSMSKKQVRYICRELEKSIIEVKNGQ